MADPGTISGEREGKLGLEATENSIFQKLISKIVELLRKSQKFEIATKIDW